MPTRLNVARRAVADLEAIEDYGRQVHGEAQAIRYADDLLVAMHFLLDFPNVGPGLGRRGLRRKGCGSHVIFYRIDGDIERIVRVLHQRMDPSRHL
jgi:toxin ParE1/3/4